MCTAINVCISSKKLKTLFHRCRREHYSKQSYIHATTSIPLLYECKQMAKWNIIRNLFSLLSSSCYGKVFSSSKNKGLHLQWHCWKREQKNLHSKSIVIRSDDKITLRDIHWHVHVEWRRGVNSIVWSAFKSFFSGKKRKAGKCTSLS